MGFEELCLVGCNTTLSNESHPIFWRNTLVPCLCLKSKLNKGSSWSRHQVYSLTMKMDQYFLLNCQFTSTRLYSIIFQKIESLHGYCDESLWWSLLWFVDLYACRFHWQSKSWWFSLAGEALDSSTRVTWWFAADSEMITIYKLYQGSVDNMAGHGTQQINN